MSSQLCKAALLFCFNSRVGNCRKTLLLINKNREVILSAEESHTILRNALSNWDWI